MMFLTRRSLLMTVAAALLTLGVIVSLALPQRVTAQTEPALPSVGGDFAASGPYETTSTRTSTTTYYYPTEVGRDGMLHPVILWGNGTAASTSTYAGLLRHFASHGFIVAAANTTNAGSGSEMLAGIDGLSSVPALAGAADLEHIGATGHSQGGGGAVQAGADPRVDTVFPIEGCFGGTSGLDDTSAIFLAGQSDAIVSPILVRGCFTGADFPAAYAEAAGATHFTAIGDGGVFRAAATAWARWHLAGDTEAAGLFVGDTPGLASSSGWSEFETNEALRSLSTTPSTPPEPTAPTTTPNDGDTPAPTDPAEPPTTAPTTIPDDSDLPVPPTLDIPTPTAPGAGTGSLADFLNGDGDRFDQNIFDFDLVTELIDAVVTADPESPLSVLAQGDQPITAFLPTDHAFHLLVRDLTDESLRDEEELFNAVSGLGLDTVEQILTYHLVPETALSWDDVVAADGNDLAPALDGGTIQIERLSQLLPLIRLVDTSAESRDPFVLRFGLNDGNVQIAHGISRVLQPGQL
jgi:hypothetical protein